MGNSVDSENIDPNQSNSNNWFHYDNFEQTPEPSYSPLPTVQWDPDNSIRHQLLNLLEAFGLPEEPFNPQDPEEFGPVEFDTHLRQRAATIYIRDIDPDISEEDEKALDFGTISTETIQDTINLFENEHEECLHAVQVNHAVVSIWDLSRIT